MRWLLGSKSLRTMGQEVSFEGDWPNLFVFVLNNPAGFVDSFGLEVYKSCKEDTTQGGFKPTRSVPTGKRVWVPFLGDADEMRVTQRKCNFRCYHKDTDNCYRIPCKSRTCQLNNDKDHGVSIQVTINASGSGAAATCSEIAAEVKKGSLTGGSIVRNYKPKLKKW